MATKSDIVNFLKTDVNVARLNFAFGTFRVYPTAYQLDVAGVINGDAVKFGSNPPKRAGASYDTAYDRLDLRPGFTISNGRDRAFLVHECTHIHFDIQAMGSHSSRYDEAAAYIAEAMYLEGAGLPPLGSEPIRTIAHPIARGLLQGKYAVDATDITALTAAVAAEPIYASPEYPSNGFGRGFMQNLLR